MLRTAKSDTFCAKLTGHSGIVRCVGIGTNRHTGIFIGKLHDFSEIIADGRFLGFHLSVENFAGRSIQGDPVTFVVYFTACFHGTGLVVDSQCACTGNTTFSHSTGDNGCVGGHPSAGSQDTASNVHSFKILRRSLDPYQDRVVKFLGLVGKKYNLAGGSSR